MPTASERARLEADGWPALAVWSARDVPELHDDVPPNEHAVVRFFDPSADLAKRAAEWRFDLDGHDLDHLAAFAEHLARVESDAWERDVPDRALRAYEARRLLIGDRIIHWAVPWLDAVGRCYPEHRDMAHSGRDRLLDLGDEMRPAPSFGGREGMALPGEDSFGPVDPSADLPTWLGSLWSGAVMLGATQRSMQLSIEDLDELARLDLQMLYENFSGRWRSLARDHAGTEALWLDLAVRAERTADLLGTP